MIKMGRELVPLGKEEEEEPEFTIKISFFFHLFLCFVMFPVCAPKLRGIGIHNLLKILMSGSHPHMF